MLTKERRKHVRRQADVDLQDRIRAFGDSEDPEALRARVEGFLTLVDGLLEATPEDSEDAA